MFSEHDNDSLHILPLSLVPIETAALRSARLIKNSKLVSVAELFRDDKSGSGQLDVDQLAERFGWPKDCVHPDQDLLYKLASLSSYDVYSLRLSLRELGIPIDHHTALRLSESKQHQLSDYMKVFTRALTIEVFGSDQMDITGENALQKILGDPDSAKVLERLHRLASKLRITIEDVPKFLDDYGDIYLSLCYYRDCLDRTVPIVAEFLMALQGIRNNWEVRKNANLIRLIGRVDAGLNEATGDVLSRLEVFDRRTAEMWQNISAERFREVEKLIQSSHRDIGAILCGLSVKMAAWQAQFSSPGDASPSRMANFLLSEMRPGMACMRPSKPERDPCPAGGHDCGAETARYPTV